MKKKSPVPMFALLLVISLFLSACRNTEPERPGTLAPGENPTTGAPSEPGPATGPGEGATPGTSPEPVMSERITDEIVRIMTSEAYTMQTKTYVDFMGREFEVSSTISKNGDEAAMKTDFGGMDTTLLMRDEKLHIISHDHRRIMVVGGSDLSDVPGGQNPDIRLEGIRYAGSGTGEFRGTSYSYEEYTLEKGMTRFYFDDSRVVGMVYIMDQAEVQMEILSIEERADASMFVLPSDYPVTDTTRP